MDWKGLQIYILCKVLKLYNSKCFCCDICNYVDVQFGNKLSIYLNALCIFGSCKLYSDKCIYKWWLVLLYICVAGFTIYMCGWILLYIYVVGFTIYVWLVLLYICVVGFYYIYVVGFTIYMWLVLLYMWLVLLYNKCGWFYYIYVVGFYYIYVVGFYYIYVMWLVLL